jgi:hypothetical protein
VCKLETSKEEAKSPLKGCEYKPTMGCEAERKKNIIVITIVVVVVNVNSVELHRRSRIAGHKS